MQSGRLTATSVLAILVMSGFLTACTASPSSRDLDTLKTRIAELEQENQQLKKQLEERNRSSPENKTNVSSSTPGGSNPTIELGQPVVVPDFAELTIKKVGFGQRIDPSNPEGYYSYYQMKTEGEIYLDTVVSVKSLLTTRRDTDEFADVKVVYDGKYEYRTFSPAEESGGGDFDILSSLEPLKSVTVHFIAELPAESANDGKPLKIILSSKGKTFVYNFR